MMMTDSKYTSYSSVCKERREKGNVLLEIEKENARKSPEIVV